MTDDALPADASAGATEPPAIRRASWRIDVSDAVSLPGRFEIAVDIVSPASPITDPIRRPLLACLPGGFLSRRYFDLEVAGDRRYSFAEAMAQRGYVTLAFDHLGTGESTRPEPSDLGYQLGVREIAAANQRALEGALARLAEGDPGAGILPFRDPVTIGVGHSMGSMLSVEQQALARPHEALLLFSFSTHGTPQFLDAAMRGYADDPERLRREIGDLARVSMGTPYPERATNSEDDRRAAFGVGSAPAGATDALHSASTNLLAVGGLTSMVPGGFAPSAAQIDVPVFMLVGDHDLHDDRHTRAELPRSPAVTTFILDDCWHCHFVANTRETLWNRASEWIQATLTH